MVDTMEMMMRERRCYICQSFDTTTSAEVFALPADNDPLNILICQKCGHASRINLPDFEKNLNNQEARFDKITQEPLLNLPWYNRLNLVAAQLERIIPGRGKILDIGCGSGQWLLILNEKWEKHGVEVSPVAAKIAEKFVNGTIFCGPIETYKAEWAPFDAITAFALIEHLVNPRNLIEWVYKHLKPGGILLLMTGDRESKIARQQGFKWRQYTPPEHLHFFSSRSLGQLVTDTGFIIRRCEWRHVFYGKYSLIASCIGKGKEFLRLLRKPIYDHLYIYAQKSF